MILLILETIGTQELILVGLVALIVFGPRKLPQLARKAGKIMTEFRKVSNDFRSTWEREVAFEDEKTGTIAGHKDPVKPIGPRPSGSEPLSEGNKAENDVLLPEVKEVSKEDFESLASSDGDTVEDGEEGPPSTSDKRNWL